MNILARVGEMDLLRKFLILLTCSHLKKDQIENKIMLNTS